MELIEFEQIDSTNDYIKRNMNQLKHFTVVHSYYQTNGKGRNGHIWESKKGENLLISFLLKECENISHTYHMTQVATLAILNVLQEYQIPAQIKWPNDIFVDNQKIGGILVEAIFEETLQAIVIGIGLNVNTRQFQSMSRYKNKKIDIRHVRTTLIKCMETVYAAYIHNGYTEILQIVNQNSYLKGKWISYHEYGEIQFQELLEDGTLLVKDRNKNKFKLYINEISLH